MERKEEDEKAPKVAPVSSLIKAMGLLGATERQIQRQKLIDLYKELECPKKVLKK